jgi:insulysin
MNEDATDRELLAVNSEHLNNLQNDYWRSLQLRKSICNPAHPFAKFGTGNKDTLTTKDNSPRSVRDALLQFHKEHYFASRMNLCLISNRYYFFLLFKFVHSMRQYN